MGGVCHPPSGGGRVDPPQPARAEDRLGPVGILEADARIFEALGPCRASKRGVFEALRRCLPVNAVDWRSLTGKACCDFSLFSPQM